MTTQRKASVDKDVEDPEGPTIKKEEELSVTASLLPKVEEAAKDEAKRQEAAAEEETSVMEFVSCVIGLQASYLTWGYIQEKVMTKTYETGEHFPSATFCVFSNRIFAIMAAAGLVMYNKGSLQLSAPLRAFAPPAVSNTLSSFAQYEALHYVSFPLQTLSKSTKVIPVMIMGKLLNKKVYPWVDYIEAVIISAGVSIFALTTKGGGHKSPNSTGTFGVGLLAMYVACDSFTSQYQSRVYKAYPKADQYEMMLATNMWAIIFTLSTLVATGELWTTLAFLQRCPSAILDNLMIAITSATGQLVIFYTIRKFGPVAFVLIMTTRQMFSLIISTFMFGHQLGQGSLAGAALVFATLFYRSKRNLDKKRKEAEKETEKPSPGIDGKEMGSLKAPKDGVTVDLGQPVTDLLVDGSAKWSQSTAVLDLETIQQPPSTYKRQ